MPYIVTTRRPLGVSKSLEPACKVSRRAVATLRDATRMVDDATAGPWPYEVAQRIAAQVMPMSPDGCTVGPLPDGTVIVVETVDWRDIVEGAGDEIDRIADDQDAKQVLSAYNAKQVA